MMRRTAVVFFVFAMSLLFIMSANAAVNNFSLMPIGDKGVTGTATALTSMVSGSTPFINIELNAKVNSAPPMNMMYQAWFFNTKTSSANSLGVFNGTMFNMKTRIASWSNMPYDSIAVSLESVNNTSTTPGTIVARGLFPGSPVMASDFPTMAVLPSDEMFQQQVVMQRFKLTSSQIMDLRMRGWGYSDIAAAANAASRCNKSINDVVAMLESGQSWDMIASTCNITTAQLLEPVPMTAVAGYMGTITPSPMATGTIMVPTVYLKYPNGRPVVTRDAWVNYSRQGHSWMDVARAANISAKTGESMDDLLRMSSFQGMTWRDIAIQHGLNINSVMDVSMWPFEQGPAQKNWQQGMPGSTGTAGTMNPTPPSSGMTTPSTTNGGSNY